MPPARWKTSGICVTCTDRCRVEVCKNRNGASSHRFCVHQGSPVHLQSSFCGPQLSQAARGNLPEIDCINNIPLTTNASSFARVWHYCPVYTRKANVHCRHTVAQLPWKRTFIEGGERDSRGYVISINTIIADAPVSNSRIDKIRQECVQNK